MDDLGSVDRQAIRRRLERLAGSEALRLARGLDLDLRQDSTPGGSLVYWEEASGLASVGGARLVDFDREARRATALLGAEAGEREQGPGRPEPIGSAGFQVVGSATGSLDFLLAPMGLTIAVLMSDPVQFLLTTQALLTDAAWVVRVWRKAGLPLPPHPSVDDVRRALGGVLQRAADAVLPPQASSETAAVGRPTPGSRLESTLESGRLIVRGDQIITVVTGLGGKPTFIRYEPARHRR